MSNPLNLTSAQKAKVEIKIIGKVEALRLLTQANYQRKTSNMTVKRYAREMLAGNWHFNGQPIVQYKDQVLNGVHRLKALVLANETQEIELPFVVVTGVHPSALHTIDIGKGRTLDQLLRIDGEEPSASILAKALQFLDGYRGTDGRDWLIGGSTILDKYALLESEPGIRDYVKPYLKVALVNILKGMFVTVHYLLALKCKPEADIFMGEIVSGANLKPGDASFEFRAFVLRHAKEHYPIRLIGNGFVEAWNIHRKGLYCKSFRRFPESCPDID